MHFNYFGCILAPQIISNKMLNLLKDIAAILEGFYSNLALLVICNPEEIAVPICLQRRLIISNLKQKSRKDNRKTGTNAKKSMQCLKLDNMVGYVLKGIIFCTAVADSGRFSMSVKSY